MPYDFHLKGFQFPWPTIDFELRIRVALNAPLSLTVRNDEDRPVTLSSATNISADPPTNRGKTPIGGEDE